MIVTFDTYLTTKVFDTAKPEDLVELIEWIHRANNSLIVANVESKEYKLSLKIKENIPVIRDIKIHTTNIKYDNNI